MKTRLLTSAALLAMWGCSGGGGQTTPPAPPTGGRTSQTARLTLQFPIKPKPSSIARRPQFIDGAHTAQVVTTVNSVNGGAPPSWVTNPTVSPLATVGANANCTITGSTETCIVNVPAPPGSVNYTFNAEDAHGNVLSSKTQTIAISSGSNSNLSVTLDAIVHTATVSVPNLTANVPSPSGGFTLPVIALDADGGVISSPGNYTQPVTLTDTDPSGATKLSVNHGAPAATVVTTSPSDSLTITYTGLAILPATIVASGTGISGTTTLRSANNPITFTGTTTCSAAIGCLPSDANFNAPTIFFGQPSGAQSFSAAELGWSNAPYDMTFSISLDPATCGTGAGAVATVSPVSGTTSFTVTALNFGLCKATVSDAVGGSAVVWISVSTSIIIIQTKHKE